MKIKLSVIIPTYNRSEYLNKSIPTLINQSLSKSKYEIIIIDNNSSDDTKIVVEQLLKNTKYNWRYVFEPHPGLHNGRNRGFLEAMGKIVVFGDDDIEADRDWLKNIFDEFETNNKAGVVGGKIIPIWSKSPPKWIELFEKKGCCAPLSYLDYGKKRKVLDNRYLYGCNIAFRKDLAIQAGGSRPDMPTYKLRKYIGSGETGLTKAIKKLKYQVVYLPKAFVYHHIPKERLKFNYLLMRRRRFAISDIYTSLHSNFSLKKFITLFLNSLRKFAKVNFIYIFTKPTGLKLKINKLDRVYYDEQIKQFFRIIFSNKLRKHIKEKDHFKELKNIFE